MERHSMKLTHGKTVNAYLGVPKLTPAPTVVLLHERWGVKDQIKTVAQEFAEKGYEALAIDHFDGRVAILRNDA